MSYSLFEVLNSKKPFFNKNKLKGIPRLQAHRGYWQSQNSENVLRENTLEAFENASLHGYEGFECDIHLSKDGVPVVYHDVSLKRLHGIDELIKNCLFQELQKLGVSSLQQILQSPKVPKFINVEIKSKNVIKFDLEIKVIQIIQKYGSQKNIIVSSFNPLSLWVLRMLAPEIPRALLVSGELDKDNSEILRRLRLYFLAKPHMLNLDGNSISPAEVKALVERGYNISLWTINQRPLAQEYLKAGAFSIITDKILETDLPKMT